MATATMATAAAAFSSLASLSSFKHHECSSLGNSCSSVFVTTLIATNSHGYGDGHSYAGTRKRNNVMLKKFGAVRESGWMRGRKRNRVQGRRKMVVTAAVKGGVAVDVDAPPSTLVDQLLSLVEGTDRGTQIGEQEKRAIDEIVAKLETLCIPEPLSSPLLFGDWEVAYSSNPTAPGGYYRSMLGRALLKTRDMVQSINAPDAITNRVAFDAFGLLGGQVTLQGTLTALDKKWVEVVFEPPEVALGALKLQYGGASTVKLAILYLDEVVRIGRGSRGSLFIFQRRT